MKYIAVTIAFVFGFFAVLYTIGYIEMFLGITTPTEIPIAIEGTYDYSVTKMQLIGQNIGSLLFILLCIIMFSYLFSLYHRLNKKKKDTYDKDNIKEPFVLYLRSFIDDKTTQKRVSFINDIRSEEEVLVEVMSDIAPVYAIGDPRDKKMPLGASRIYVDDEHWKSTVIDMMNRAEIVILRLGKTDSFWWEVETAIKSIPIEKIMFVVPESKTFGNVAMLYKILLDNKIDIKQLNVNIEQKSQGSISSFLYFDKNGEAVTTEVKIPRFSHLILSYENILRNALAKFREKYGLKTNPQRTIRWSRILGILSVICILFIGSAKMFSDLVTLKCQMPYELVEECIKDKSFVEKYSDEVNGTNLTWGIVESRKGTFALDDNEYLFLFQVEALTMQSMDKGEFNLLQLSPENLLLMIKKYQPEYYESYVKILSMAAIHSIQNSAEIENLIQQYKKNINFMPQWITDYANSDEIFEDEYDYTIRFNQMVLDHINDKNIADILKTLSSQSFK